MASVKGTNFTNITADPVVKVDSGMWSGKLRVQKSAGSDARVCAFRIDVLSSANVQITVTDT